jgi:hypothetical protein
MLLDVYVSVRVAKNAEQTKEIRQAVAAESETTFVLRGYKTPFNTNVPLSVDEEYPALLIITTSLFGKETPVGMGRDMLGTPERAYFSTQRVQVLPLRCLLSEKVLDTFQSTGLTATNSGKAVEAGEDIGREI